jgi:hypothetical protein
LSQGPYEFSSSDVFELARLNRAIEQLAKPTLSDEWLTSPERTEQIQRMWCRKRQLLRQAAKNDRWGPEFPVA